MDLRDFFDDPEDETYFGIKGDPFKDDKEFLALLKEEIKHSKNTGCNRYITIKSLCQVFQTKKTAPFPALPLF